MSLTPERLKALLALPSAPPVQGRVQPAYSTFLVPPGSGPFPAILYCHAHGFNYVLGRRELEEGRKALATPYAEDLLEAGYAVLCIDMPGFGERQSEGTESQLSKRALWHGRPLFGQMVAEQLAGFEWLLQNPLIDASRIATLGISMGAALAFFTAAVERRIKACVQLCVLANIETLIADQSHDLHGHYLTIPRLLQFGDLGDVAGLIAPRPQFIGHGALDALTPDAARQPALDAVRAAYGASQQLDCFLAQGHGHFEPPEMRAAVLKFLAHYLGICLSR